VIGIRHEAAESEGMIIAGFEVPAEQAHAHGQQVSVRATGWGLRDVATARKGALR
jgi:hypothetical protein